MKKSMAGLLAPLALLGSMAMQAQTLASATSNASSPATTTGTHVNIPEFDTVSIRPHKGDDRMRGSMMKADGYSGTNVSLTMLLSSAYHTRPYLISGLPAWADNTGFDIEAKVAGQDVEALKQLKPEDRMGMLQSVLAERFHVAVHTETKTMPIYDMVVANGGVKMTASPEPPAAPDAKPGDPPKNRTRLMMRPGQMDGTDMPTTFIANQVANVLQKNVVDKTGLTGKYNFTLKYQDENPGGPVPHTADAESEPSIFTALQEQLGLRLVSAKGPVETLVVDKAEKPSEN